MKNMKTKSWRPKKMYIADLNKQKRNLQFKTKDLVVNQKKITRRLENNKELLEKVECCTQIFRNGKKKLRN